LYVLTYIIQILLFLENTEEEFLVCLLSASAKCFPTYRDCSPLDPKASKTSLMFVRCELQLNAIQSCWCLSIKAISKHWIWHKVATFLKFYKCLNTYYRIILQAALSAG